MRIIRPRPIAGLKNRDIVLFESGPVDPQVFARTIAAHYITFPPSSLVLSLGMGAD